MKPASAESSASARRLPAHPTRPAFRRARPWTQTCALFALGLANACSEVVPLAPATSQDASATRDAGPSAGDASDVRGDLGLEAIDAAPRETSDATAAESPGDAAPARSPDAGALDAAGPADAGLREKISGSFVRLTEFSQFMLDEVSLGTGGTLLLGAGAGYAASDPYGAGGYRGANYYNGGNYRYGVAVSPILEWDHPIDELVPSFEADTPPGSWITVKARARLGGTWSKDYVLGVWAYERDTVERHSVDGQGDGDGEVFTDTLSLSRSADAIQLIAVLCSEDPAVTPSVRALSASAIDTSAAPRPDSGDPNALGTTLAVPGRSQMIYPNGGEVWCSPTSLSMLLAYWSDRLAEPQLLETVPSAAALTYDWIYGGNGNWPFNTAHASAVAGGRLHGLVTRLESFGEVERLIGAGIPVAISVSYGSGELDHSPIRSTAGHLLVVKGFTAGGDVVANDPAFDSNARVEVVYDRAELDRAWSHSRRTVYVVYPRELLLPPNPLGAY